ncbi:MAG: hypothetical protein V5A68_06965 [Candidatus Thermoplasmatota archaeon]
MGNRLDRDIPQSDWYQYIKKQYGKKYRIFRDELGIWSIKCKYGFLQPYSIVKKELVAVLTYKTLRGVNILLKKLQRKTAPDFRISQLGDFEVSIVFNEKDVKYFAELLKFNYKRQISEKERKKLIQRLKKAREAKKKVGEKKL